MSNKARTSLTLSEIALQLAKERREALDYDSVSEYIEFLILEDARQKRAHRVTRGEGGVKYEATPERLHTEAQGKSADSIVSPMDYEYEAAQEILRTLKVAEGRTEDKTG